MSKTPDEITTLTWWLKDAASILRQNGTTTHADKVKEAAAAITAEREGREKLLADALAWKEMYLAAAKDRDIQLAARETAEAANATLLADIAARRQDRYELATKLAQAEAERDEARKAYNLDRDASVAHLVRQLQELRAARKKATADRDEAIAQLLHAHKVEAKAEADCRTAMEFAADHKVRAEKAEAERDRAQREIAAKIQASFDFREEWHIATRRADRIRAETIEACAKVVEECSKRPQTTWGEVKTAIRALGDKSAPNVRAETIEQCAKVLDKLGINACEHGAVDPSTGTFECSRLHRGDCNCFEFDEAAEAIRKLGTKS